MVSKVRSYYPLAIVALAMLMLVLYKPLSAQQVATDILDDVVIERSDFNAVIKVLFKQPFGYISHSPTKSGNTINVRVRIIESDINSSSQIIDNESIVVKDGKGTGLTEVIYEKNGPSSQYINFYFNKDVSFEVIQGSDKRSLSIIVHGME